MSCKQFQEQCAVELEKLDCAHGCGVGSEIAQKIRTMPLPSVNYETARQAFEKWVVDQGVAMDYRGDGIYGNPTVRRWHEGFIAAIDTYGSNAEIESLRKENDRLRSLLESAANGLRWYQDHHPEDGSEADYEMLEQIDAVLKGGAA